MKKLIVLIGLFTLITSSFAQECQPLYKEAGRKREVLNSVLLIGAGAAVATASSVGIILIAGPAALGGAAITTGAKLSVYGLYATAIGGLSLPAAADMKNKFDKMDSIITASRESNVNDKSFQKLIRKIRREAEKTGNDTINNMNDVTLNDMVSRFVDELSANGTLCPTVEEKEKSALFNIKSLARLFVASQQ